MTNSKPGDGGIKHRIAHTFFFKLWYLNNLRIFMLGVCLEELRGSDRTVGPVLLAKWTDRFGAGCLEIVESGAVRGT